MVADRVSNLMIKLKNAGTAGMESTVFPYSRYTESILEVLKEHSFISGFSKKSKKNLKYFAIDLAYDEGKKPKIGQVKRISKLSKRVYGNTSQMKPVQSGFGLMVVSTSKGIMSGEKARELKIGGEMLFKIW